MQKIIILTEGGKAPGKEYVTELLRNYFPSGEFRVLGGVQYNNPRHLLKTLKRDDYLVVDGRGEDIYVFYDVSNIKKELRNKLKETEVNAHTFAYEYVQSRLCS